MRFPPETKAVAGEPTSVVAEPQIQVTHVAFDVVEAVRIDDTARGTGKIVVQRFLGVLRVEPALTEQKPQEFLVFGIHTYDGVGRLREGGAVAGDDLELPISVDMSSKRQRFASLSASQAMAFKKLRHDGDTHAIASPQKFFGNLGTRQVGPKNAVLIRIARRVRIDDFQEGFVDSWKKRQTALPATPFFRAR